MATPEWRFHRLPQNEEVKKDAFRLLIAAQDVEHFELWITQELYHQRLPEVAEKPVNRSSKLRRHRR